MSSDKMKSPENGKSAALASAELFSATFEQAAVGIAHVAPDGRWLRVNRKLCDIVGYSQDELMKLTFQDITFPDDLETDLEYARQMLAGEIKTYSMEKRYIRKDKSIVWIYLTVSLVRKPSGEPEYFISVVEDIVRRKQAEAALRETQRQLTLLIANLPGVVYRCRNDLNWTTEFVSEGALQLFGYPAADFMEHRLEIGQLIHADDQGRVWEEIQAALRECRRYEVAYRLITASGVEKWLWEQGAGVFDASGTLQALEGFVIDITQRKQAELRTARLSRLYSVLSKVDEVIVRIREPEKLYQVVCRIIVEDGLFRMAWVGIVEPETLLVKPVAIHGHEDGYLKANISPWMRQFLKGEDLPEPRSERVDTLSAMTSRMIR